MGRQIGAYREGSGMEGQTDSLIVTKREKDRRQTERGHIRAKIEGYMEG